MGMTIKQHREEDVVRLELSGDLDVFQSPTLRQEVIDIMEGLVPTRTLVVDLLETRYVDATGLGVLIGAHRRCVERDIQMKVVVPDRILRIFEITGLDRVFALFTELPKATSPAPVLAGV